MHQVANSKKSEIKLGRNKSGEFVQRKEKTRAGSETLTLRDAKGRIRTLTTKASSAKIMDRSVKKYSGALKSLAKR